MAKQKPIINLTYPVFEQEKLDRLFNAAEKLDCTWSELLDKALELYLSSIEK